MESKVHFTVRKETVIEWGMEEDSRFVKVEYSYTQMFPSLGRDKQISAVTAVNCRRLGSLSASATSLEGTPGLLKVDK